MIPAKEAYIDKMMSNIAKLTFYSADLMGKALANEVLTVVTVVSGRHTASVREDIIHCLRLRSSSSHICCWKAL
ncbi:hypothetical protein KSS87_011849 [Heliosperma pusillum]|nr:hypothetical protein KSS87_009454 [Heliosperma pusillum]KAH9608855.1 hypothetical protein KSS87_015894 [Heliosperma pusillum]KAH9620449.1 hypothetical protein KSS87_011849 [Heliosperma pusillum]